MSTDPASIPEHVCRIASEAAFAEGVRTVDSCAVFIAAALDALMDEKSVVVEQPDRVLKHGIDPAFVRPSDVLAAVLARKAT